MTDKPKPGQQFLWGDLGEVTVATVRGGLIKFRDKSGRLLQCELGYFQRMAEQLA